MNTQEKIAALRNRGFTIRVHHVREFNNVAADTDDGLDFMLTRGEFDRAVKDGSLRYVDFIDDETINTYTPEGDETVFGKQVSPMGGFTSVVIEKNNVVIAKGKQNFNNKQFNKRIGLTAAFGKAIKNALSDNSTTTFVGVYNTVEDGNI